MTVKNSYVKCSRVSEPKFRQIVRLFAVDLEATQIAKITGLSRNTINRYLRAIRIRLAQFCKTESPLTGEVEVDESYFGARRIKGKRGRGAYGKTIVFGVFKRNGKVYTEIVPDCSKATLQPVIRGKVSSDSVIYSDGCSGSNGLVGFGFRKPFLTDHSNAKCL